MKLMDFLEKYIFTVEDKIVFDDDNQIIELIVLKRYGGVHILYGI